MQVLPENGREAIAWAKNSTGGSEWAVISDLTAQLRYEAQDCKRLILLPETFNKASTVAFGWPKNSYFADKMNQLIQEVVETGAFQRSANFWFRSVVGPPCPADRAAADSDAFRPMDAEQLLGPLAVAAILVAGGLLLLGFECLAA